MTEPMTIGPFDQTWFCNEQGYDIRRIKPYSAYDVGADVWVEKPPHLPHWSLSELPKPVQQVLRAADSYARHVLKLPEPERTQQGAALFESWHSDRSRAFSDRGEGWWDIANLREKWGDQSGWWAELVACKRRADQGLDKAPEDWSNIPTGYVTAGLAGRDWDEQCCTACSGTGEQGTGHECYQCDGSGSRSEQDPTIDNANPENGLLVGRDDERGIKPVTAATDKWPPYLTERPDEDGYPAPVNVSRSNPRGPVGTEEEAKAAGWVGPFFHGTSKRRAQDIRRNGFRQPRLHNWEMANAGTAEEVDMGHTHRTFFAEKHEDAQHFAQSNHGDQVDVVKAYLHPDHIERDSGGGWMPSVQVRDVAHAMAINDRPRRRTAARREPVDMSRYFAGSVKDLHSTPWRLQDKHIALDPQTWASLPVEDVPTTGNYATQSKVFHKHLDRHERNGEPDGGDLPWVVEHEGKRWVVDGHHRFVKAQDRGMRTLPAHVMRPFQREAKLPKTQKCEYCRQRATKRVLHAEGMAYIPVCDRHESRAKDEVGDDYCNTKPIPKVAALGAASSSWTPDMDITSRPDNDFSHRLLSGTLKSVKYPDEVDHPLYHGTRAELSPGDHVEAGHPGNFVRRMKHVYSAETPEGARHYGNHVYEVRPTGPIGHRSDARAENGYWASIFPLRVVRKVPHDEIKPRQATSALVLHLCAEGTPAHRIASMAGDPDQLMPHQAAVYRAQSAMTRSRKDLHPYLNHLHAQDMCRAVLTEQGHPHGDKLLVTHANHGRSYVKYDSDNSWPRIGLAPNHLHSHAVFHELAHILTNGDHESTSDEEAHGPAFVHTFRHLLDSYDSSAARQVFDEHYQPPGAEPVSRQASTGATLYHWAPKAAREDIAEHGLDHRRAPGFNPTRQGPHGTFMHHSEDLARDWVHDIERTHDLYEVRAGGLKLHPDPYDTGDASYTEHPVPPDRLRRMAARSAQASAGGGTTVRYVRNNGGMRHIQGYGQDVEPWGRYMSERSGEHVPDGWEAGEVHFDNPLHVEHDGGAWKHQLSDQHGGRTGKELSSALLAKGHDAVITHDKHGIGEIVDIRPREQRTHQVTSAGVGQVWITPQLVMGSAAGLNHARAVNSASEAQRAISEGLTAVLPAGSWFIARQALQALGMSLLDVTQRLRQLGAPA